MPRRAGQRKIPALPPEGSVAARAVERALAARYAAYADEVGRFVEAGVVVMRRRSTFDPKVKELIDEAGLSNQAFYRHFQSKEELLLAILDAGTRRLDEYLQHRMEKVPEPLAKVRAWVQGFAAQAIRPDAAAATRPFVIPSARLQERFPLEILEIEDQLTGPLEAAIAAGVAAGALRADLEPRETARTIYDLIKEWLPRQLSADPLPPAAALKQSAGRLEDFVVHAIARTGRR
jgi:AcrR family transcriptional regulator